MYFIAVNGKVYADNRWNVNIPRLDIKNNLFERREEAWFASKELEEYNPMIFYGKPATKNGLLLHARGDSETTYKTRT